MTQTDSASSSNQVNDKYLHCHCNSAKVGKLINRIVKSWKLPLSSTVNRKNSMKGGKRFTVNCSLSVAALKLKYETDNFEGFLTIQRK